MHKLLLFILFAAGICCGGAENMEKLFSPGGLSIDFFRSFPVQADSGAGPNLLQNGDFEQINPANGRPLFWGCGFNAVSPNLSPEQRGKLTEMMNSSPGLACRTATSPDGNYLSVEIPDFGEYSGAMRAYCIQEIELPPGRTRDSRFRLRFQYRGRGDCQVAGALHGFDADRKELRLAMRNPAKNVDGDWRQGEVVVTVPAECVMLRVALRQFGSGQSDFRGVCLRRLPDGDADPSLCNVPFGCLDNTYHIAPGKIGILTFLLADPSGKPRKNPRLLLELPEGLELLSTGDALRPASSETGQDGKKHRLNITAPPSRQRMLFLAIHSRELPGGKAFLSYSYEDDEFKGPNRRLAVVNTVPRKAETPGQFTSGLIIGSEAAELLRDPEVMRKMAEYAAYSGFRTIRGGMVMAGSDGKLNPQLSAAGVRACHDYGLRVSMHSGALANAYRIGGRIKPEGLKFVDCDGKPVTEGRYEWLCPTAIYRRSDYFEDAMRKHRALFEEIGLDALEPNWEPFICDSKGCFCPACRREFQEFSGIPAAELDAVPLRDWPVKYRGEWISFRSRQHGLVMEAVVNSLKPFLFVPTIDGKELNGVNPLFYAMSSYRDYAGKLSEMVLWSPYIHHRLFTPYLYSRDSLRAVDDTARRTVEILSSHHPDPGTRPRIISYPNAIQCDTWITEPETLSFQYLLYFLNGWNGASAYFFPEGYDARYWNALAEANEKITALEPLVVGAEPYRECAAEPASEFPEADLLRVYGFKRNGRYLFVAGNFWQSGEVFYRLRIQNLDPGKSYILRDLCRPVVYVPSAETKTFTASQLAAGILTQTGALRFSFFLLEEHDGKTEIRGTTVTPGLMEELLAGRLPEIQKSITREKEYLQRDLVTGGINAKILDGHGVHAELKDGVVQLALPWGEITLSASRGGRIVSLRDRNNQEFVNSEGLAVDGFGKLGKNGYTLIIDRPFTVETLEIKNNILEIGLVRKLRREEHPELQGMELRKTFKFSVSRPEINISSSLSNRTDGIRNGVCYLSKNVFAHFDLKRPFPGKAFMTYQARPVIFERAFTSRLYRFGNGAMPYADKLASGGIFPIDRKDLTLSDSEKKLETYLRVDTPERFYGFFFWNEGVAPCVTLELFWQEQDLKVNESLDVSYTLKWNSTK